MSYRRPDDGPDEEEPLGPPLDPAWEHYKRSGRCNIWSREEMRQRHLLCEEWAAAGRPLVDNLPDRDWSEG